MSGILPLTVAFVFPARHYGRRRFPVSYYTVDEADDLIETYNASLRDELDLTEEQVQQIDLR